MFTLYRIFDIDGVLLYVGQTNDEGSRVAEHIADKQWLPEYFNIRLQRGFKDRASVSQAEENAIKVEKPKFNVEGVTRPYRGHGVKADPVKQWLKEVQFEKIVPYAHQRAFEDYNIWRLEKRYDEVPRNYETMKAFRERVVANGYVLCQHAGELVFRVKDGN